METSIINNMSKSKHTHYVQYTYTKGWHCKKEALSKHVERVEMNDRDFAGLLSHITRGAGFCTLNQCPVVYNGQNEAFPLI